MEPIHSTPHYSILQPADGSFLIVGRTRKAREVLRDILTELEFDTESEPIRDDSSYAIPRDNPFGLVRVIDLCDARMTLAEVEQLRTSTDPMTGQTSAKPVQAALARSPMR